MPPTANRDGYPRSIEGLLAYRHIHGSHFDYSDYFNDCLKKEDKKSKILKDAEIDFNVHLPLDIVFFQRNFGANDVLYSIDSFNYDNTVYNLKTPKGIGRPYVISFERKLDHKNIIDPENVIYMTFGSKENSLSNPIPVAYILGTHINIALNLPGIKIKNCLNLLKFIAIEVIKKLEKQVEKEKNTPLPDKWSNFTESCLRRKKTKISGKINDEMNRHKHLLTETKGSKDKIDKYKKELVSLNQNKNEDGKKELSLLLKNKKIKSIDILKDTISVYTNPLEIAWKYDKDKTFKYNIGEYLIKIKISGEIEIRRHSPFAIKSEYDHPYILDGSVCWGNMSNKVSKLCNSSDVFSVIQLIIPFLETYSSGNPYVGLGRFIELISGKYPEELKKIPDRTISYGTISYAPDTMTITGGEGIINSTGHATFVTTSISDPQIQAHLQNQEYEQDPRLRGIPERATATEIREFNRMHDPNRW